MVKYKMTELQKEYLLGMDNSAFLGGSCPYIYIRTRIEGFDDTRFRQALSAVVNNNTLLHCILNNDSEWEETDITPNISYITAEENSSEYICSGPIAEQEKFRFKTYVFADGHSADVHFKFNGLIVDGMSMNIFLSQLKKAYLGEQLPETASHSEYAERIAQYTGSAKYQNDIAAIKASFNGRTYDEFTLPMKCDPTALSGCLRKCVKLPIDGEVFEKADLLAKELEVSLFSLLLGIYGKVISRISGADRFVLNIPCSARFRDMHGYSESVGLFSNFTFIPFDMSGSKSIRDAALSAALELKNIQHSRFITGSRLIPLTGLPAENCSKNMVFTMLPLGGDKTGASFTMADWSISTNQAMLEADILRLDGEPYISINYPDKLFDTDTVRDIAEMFVLTLNEAVTNGGRSVSVSLPREYQAKISAVNSTVRYIPEKSLCDVLMEGFEKYADDTLLIFRDKKYTYSEIYKFSAAIGKRLGSDTGNVMLLLPKCVEQFAASYAVLLSGGAYMPADISYTASEIGCCIEKADIKAIITNRALSSGIPDDFSGNILIIEDIDLNDCEGFIPRKTLPKDRSILINTSGTTGRPKSVILSSSVLVNCLDYTPVFCSAERGDTLLALTNYCHDMAIFDTLGQFFYGGCTVIPDEQQAREPKAWIELINKYNVDLWESVPSFMEMLMAYAETEKKAVRCEGFKTIMHGGETLKPTVAKFITEAFPNVTLYNVGGPSESTIWSIFHKVTEDDIADTIPYGIPLPNIRWHVFNDKYEECPCGTIGTLHVSGSSLSDGYIGNPEETNAKFTYNNGIRYYNTGDIGFRRRDGELVILGRNDFQVKIHGKRIELAGIESILESHCNILKACVIFTEKLGKLCAVYTSTEKIQKDELDSYLKSRLADYQLPRLLVKVDTIPLSRNGKADRKAIERILLEQISKEHKTKDSNSSCSCTVKNKIIEIFEDELDCDINDGNENFYEIGGNSLSAVKIAAKLNQLIDSDISVFDIINSESINKFIESLN